MIIWLASYPKSGNTWVRLFLTSILHSNEGNIDFKDINKIGGQYPLRSHFENFIKDFNNINEIKNEWINTQDFLNLDNKTKFLKTHHVNCKIGTSSFTNLNNTLGVIYIVRDPRNVITSIMHHFSKKSYKEAEEFIFDEKKWLGILKENEKKIKNYDFPTLIGSWKTHYNSWKIVNKNFLLIKYEELLLNPDNEFKKIIEYLRNFIEVNIDHQKFKKAIEACSFQNLKSLENKKGFAESMTDKESNINKRFFNLGPDNNWKKLLDKDIRLKIEDKFKSEMLELGYL